MKQSDSLDVFSPIREVLQYWLAPGTGDRLKDDRDCQLTGSLYADTIISPWLPLRFTLNRMGKPMWRHFLDYEYQSLRPQRLRLKTCPEFLSAMIAQPESFLDLDTPLVQKLSKLMKLGMQRENVMILLDRSWNVRRGRPPYFDYFPHYLHDLFEDQEHDVLVSWLEEQHLQPLFEDGILEQTRIKDLAGTGDPRRHQPQSIDLMRLFENYIRFLEERRLVMDDTAAAA